MASEEILIFLLRVRTFAFAQSSKVITFLIGEQIGLTLLVKLNGSLPEVELALLQPVKQWLDQIPLTLSERRCLLIPTALRVNECGNCRMQAFRDRVSYFLECDNEVLLEK